MYLNNVYIKNTEEDEGETTTEAERDVEATQQRDIKTKKPLLHVIYCNNMQLRLVQSLISTIGDFIESNYHQN